MSTGLFPIRFGAGGPRKGYVPKNRRRPEPPLDAFAEALAETGCTIAASAHVGISKAYGRALLGRIRKSLGWQAA